MALGTTIAFLGAGNMAEALVKGLLRAGVAAPSEILCTDRRHERGPELSQRYGIRFTPSNVDAVREAGVVVLSVKPQVMDKVLDEIGPHLDQTKLVISIAAGVPLAAIERKVGHGVRIVRCMPNTPALVGAGATALSPGEHATEADLKQAKALFDAVGTSVIVDEGLLDAVTGLSGSGPAYIFLVIEALADGGVKAGLSRQHAMDLAAQTVFGSAKLLIETGEHPGRLKDQVTSPGGTAIAGLHTLEAGGLRTTLMNAVESATNRSRELGKKFLERDEG
jgi:pyrroline-5-carboxylate reductase